MPRPSNAQRKFIELYIGGPDNLRGRWTDCAMSAGLDPLPPATDPMLRRLIEKAGGVPPMLYGAPSEALPPTEVDPIAALLEAKEAGIPWSEIRGRVSDVIEGIARATVKASAAQVSMLKFVVEKAEAETATDEKTTQIVLLPTQGSGATLELSAAARKRIAEALRASH